MIAKQNEYLEEAAKSIFKLNADEAVRQRCEAREEYYRIQRVYLHTIDDLEEAVAQKDAALIEKENALAETQAALSAKDNTIAELMKKLAVYEGKQ